MTTTEQRTFTVPTRADVSAGNQAIFDTLQKKIGFVPNLYAYFAKNETALGDYLTLQSRKSTLSAQEREVINLVTSQLNGCRYCQSAHTVIGKMNGFTDEQIIDIRNGYTPFNKRIDALVKFTASVVTNKGYATADAKEEFFKAGYNEANLIDVVIAIADKVIMNYLHNLTGVEIDFPIAEEI